MAFLGILGAAALTAGCDARSLDVKTTGAGGADGGIIGGGGGGGPADGGVFVARSTSWSSSMIRPRRG